MACSILALTILSFYSFGQILASNKKIWNYIQYNTVFGQRKKIMQNHKMIYVFEHSSNTDTHISNKADINKGQQHWPIKCLYWIIPTPSHQILGAAIPVHHLTVCTQHPYKTEH